MPKYRDYFRQMMEENEALFAKFADVHARYILDKKAHYQEFNEVGKHVVELMYEWEKKLCGHSEKGAYAKFSSQLADKFRAEAKAFFPMIDFVGVKFG